MTTKTYLKDESLEITLSDAGLCIASPAGCLSLNDPKSIKALRTAALDWLIANESHF